MTIQVQIVSPEHVLWSGEAEMVTTRTVEGGDITFLTGHAPFVGALEIGQVTVRPAEGDDLHFAVHGGFVEISGDEVSVLSDVAEAMDQVDVERARVARDRARAALSADIGDVEAVSALRRAELRLQIVGASGDSA